MAIVNWIDNTQNYSSPCLNPRLHLMLNLAWKRSGQTSPLVDRPRESPLVKLLPGVHSNSSTSMVLTHDIFQHENMVSMELESHKRETWFQWNQVSTPLKVHNANGKLNSILRKAVTMIMQYSINCSWYQTLNCLAVAELSWNLSSFFISVMMSNLSMILIISINFPNVAVLWVCHSSMTAFTGLVWTLKTEMCCRSKPISPAKSLPSSVERHSH